MLTKNQDQESQAQQIDQKQLREKIKQFLGGNHAVVTDNQFVQVLALSVNRLLESDNNQVADKLLIQMVIGLQEDDSDIRRGCAEALGRTIANLVRAEEWQRLDKLLPALEEALPFIADQEAASQASKALKQLTRHSITHKEYTRAINALNLLFNLTIRPPYPNNPSLRNLAQTQLDLLAEPTLLAPMLKTIQTGGEESDNCEYLFSKMGARAANFLRGELSTSENLKERALLLNLIKKIDGFEDYSPKVKAAADSALHASNSSSKVLTTDSVQQEETVPQAQEAEKHDPLAEKEASIFRLVAQGESEAAKKELYNLIVACAKKKDFANAERLRERIYEIDPMALTEIIRSGDIIEKEKTGAVSRILLDTWAQLLKKLNNVEFAAIYHELQERTFSPEETIVKQGEKNDVLFFINQGNIKISFNKNGREVFVSSLSGGQIIGENFFNASLWTVTLTALTSVNISVLQRKRCKRWQEEFPGLEAKLHSFYNECNDTRQLLEKKCLDRRQHDRIKLSRKIQIQLTDHNENAIGRGFRGDMVDISRGGLSFLIRISKIENTRLLLGRNMRLTIPVGGDPAHLNIDGLAIGIQPFQLLDNDFSVHVKFPNLLEMYVLQQILG